MRRLLVAKPALVPGFAHLLLVADPLQVLGRDVHPWRFRRGWSWMWGFGGHEAIVPVLRGAVCPLLEPGEFLLSRHFRGRRRTLAAMARAVRSTQPADADSLLVRVLDREVRTRK